MASETYPWDCFRHNLDLDPNLCFLLSPFDSDFGGLKQVIEEVARELNLRCERADDIQQTGAIHADIWNRIQRAGVIVADITKANPNVMFELGVATAIKEQFRVILIVRQDASQTVPFDLGPFRHIRYDDTLAGSRALRITLREYFALAMSEDKAIASLLQRMESWEESDRHFSLLVDADTLGHARALAKSSSFDGRLRAYLLAASIQHGVDLDWWSKLNVDNIAAAEAATEMLVGPWIRPQFRAAYAVQCLEAKLMLRALEVVRRSTLGALPMINGLVNAVERGRLIDFTITETSGVLNEAEKYELLQNFTPRIRVHL